MHARALARSTALRTFARVQRHMQRHPLLCKSLPCAWGFAFGDFLTQFFNRDERRPYRHDFRKTAAMAAAGAVVAAPTSLLMYHWMDAAWPSAMLMVAAGKFTLDQVVGCVLWQAAYCSIPGNEWYREMLGGVLSTIASSAATGVASATTGVDGGLRDAVTYAAAAMSVVMPAAATC